MSQINSSDREETLFSLGRILKKQIVILGGLVLLAWLLEIVDALIFGGGLNGLGIQPRTLSGLRGILLMPLLHGSFSHLLANTIPFLVLGWLVMLRRTSDFTVVTVIALVPLAAQVKLTLSLVSLLLRVTGVCSSASQA